MNKPHTFFAHVAFALDSRSHATPQATANLLVEIKGPAPKVGPKKNVPRASREDESIKLQRAEQRAMTAALDYLKSQPEFRQFPAQRFVEFDLVQPTYISIQPPPTKVFRTGVKIWRLAQSDADKLRGEPRSVRYPGIERRLAKHPFFKGMSAHHIEVLALSAMPTEFDPGQIIFREGEPANGFYLIETGTVVLEGKRKDGEPVVIDTVSAGEPLGWSWLFAPYLWHLDARATERCTALCFSGIMLRQHRDEDLTLSHELFKRACEVMVRRLQAARTKQISV